MSRKKSKKQGMKNLFEKEFYIVDCNDSIYFVRPVHIIGVGGDYGCDWYYIDIDEDRRVYKWELYKTRKEAEETAKRFNDFNGNQRIRKK